MSRSGTAGPDHSALIKALFDEHAGPLFGYALRLTGDRQHAEDVVQETMLRAWRHPEALERMGGPGRAVRPWLFTVARNLIHDHHRARKARPPEVGDAALSVVPLDDELDSALESWAVAEAIGSLRPDHRRILVEIYYRQRSVREAAAVLGIPQGTVKSRTYYALRALRLALEERGLAP